MTAAAFVWYLIFTSPGGNVPVVFPVVYSTEAACLKTAAEIEMRAMMKPGMKNLLAICVPAPRQ